MTKAYCVLQLDSGEGLVRFLYNFRIGHCFIARWCWNDESTAGVGFPRIDMEACTSLDTASLRAGA